ncbi:1,4-dihydroxy-2-naphthoate polyprenyltransferase [Flavobacterium sp. xlx-214]|uniref:1,4-dihydroxy-2-naphthoate polyprenyltransferase n=1 Tax=unclassified Flavobacterium TaxID=196869 RepID=UPI0013D70E86|nr:MULTISPECIES: 1,4-dihydroxy-2-naphthoate polyprenyltransferase [unclassified Flavobacterium]MBA5793150.1 1,4-dihydroxy-2-naphthoate polyprenyltransferase [Flavobacterium sp. xlx-221]QMI82566.1 1,4-dihydroxy-2-naphthoate polyprenyltransferase [Flavobacterium sp. xlx-214]
MKKWIKAARLRTLPLSVSGILVGSAVAYQQYHTQENYYCIIVLCVLTTLFFQVLSNYANDYGDAVKGTDNENRVGPKRAVQSGEITAQQMKKAIIITSVLSLISSIGVIYLSFGSQNFLQAILYFVLAIACVGAAIKYTVGNSAYGYKGFGDVFVFIFFGLVSTLGTYYLFGHTMDYKVIFPAITIGLLSMAVLNMNNMRDVENDTAVGKNTLVVKMGFQKAKNYHFFLILIAVIFINTFAMNSFSKWYQYIYVITFIPLLKNLTVVTKTTNPRLLDPELKRLSLSTFFLSLLVSIALILNAYL